MFGRIGTAELLLILGLVLIIFGPKKLPEIGRSLGKGLREFKQATSEITTEIKDAVTAEPPAEKPAAPAEEKESVQEKE